MLSASLSCYTLTTIIVHCHSLSSYALAAYHPTHSCAVTLHIPGTDVALTAVLPGAKTISARCNSYVPTLPLRHVRY
eukprot:2937361-Rhodomonas_salina.1